jgi:hypothetical protein
MNVSDETTTNWSKRFAKPRYKEETDRPTFAQTKAMVIVLKMELKHNSQSQTDR